MQLKIYFLLYDNITSIILGKTDFMIIKDWRVNKNLLQGIFFGINFDPKTTSISTL